MVELVVSQRYNIVSGKTPLLEWAAVSAPKSGEEVSGDLFFVKPEKEGALLAVIDGLGHGHEARSTSQRVIDCLKSGSGQSLITLLERCHEKLKGTRGVVLSIARINGVKGELNWLSVGNVDGVFRSTGEDDEYQFKQLVLRSGVLGYELPSLKVATEKISEGDMLFFATDGVISEYSRALSYNRPVEETVKNTAKKYFKHSDDSLILAVRIRSTEN